MVFSTKSAGEKKSAGRVSNPAPAPAAVDATTPALHVYLIV